MANNIHCACLNCTQTKDYLRRGIWVHQGHGSLESFHDYQLGQQMPVNMAFNTIKKHHRCDFKPSNALWFSAGSWLYDPYADNGELHELPAHELEKIDYRVMQIDSLNEDRIITLDSRSSLQQFMTQYGVVNSNLVDWSEVQRDCDAVKVLFRKPSHLSGVTRSDPFYLWASAFDSESLIVLNLDVITSPVTISHYTVYL